jgi:hypothetical protein
MNFKNYFTKKPKIIEFHLLKFNEDMLASWCHILDIYQRILYKDNYWHFFYEGDYSIIRCSKKYKKNVIKYLEHCEIEYKYMGTWNDGSKAVEEYKTRFTHLFHEFSMLAIEMKEDWFMLVADRVCHCFFNHCTYMAEEARSRYGENMWEGILMGQLAIYRAHHIGKLDQDEVWKGYIAEKSEEMKV